MNLYSHWRSSASYRLRIALHLKRVAFKQITVDLTPAQSAHHRPEFKTINPQGLVPSLVLDNGCVLLNRLRPSNISTSSSRCPAPSRRCRRQSTHPGPARW